MAAEKTAVTAEVNGRSMGNKGEDSGEVNGRSMGNKGEEGGERTVDGKQRGGRG